MYYLNNFFLYSILGHIIETFVYAFHKGKSGILLGHWTPIYGIGVVLILIFYNYIIKKTKDRWKINLYTFLYSFFVLTIIEYIGGILIEKIFGVVFWSYDGLLLNIGDYISIEMAFIWGLSSVILTNFLKPLSDRVIKKIPSFITWILIVLFILDIILTII